MEKFEKVYQAMKVCEQWECADDCTGCPYEGKENCIPARDKDLLEVLETIEKQRSAGVPPMPCAVGDQLWCVFRDEMGDVHVAKDTVKELLFNGEEWLVGTGDTCYETPGDGVFLRLEEAVKYAEELLKHGWVE